MNMYLYIQLFMYLVVHMNTYSYVIFVNNAMHPRRDIHTLLIIQPLFVHM